MRNPEYAGYLKGIEWLVPVAYGSLLPPMHEQLSTPSMTRRRLLRYTLLAAGIGVASIGTAAFYEGRRLFSDVGSYQVSFGQSIETDPDGNPVRKRAEIIPIAKDKSIPVREHPSEQSREVAQLEGSYEGEVIEVLGGQYASNDGRGRKYIVTRNGQMQRYGQWFQVFFEETILGYISGNFVTINDEPAMERQTTKHLTNEIL